MGIDPSEINKLGSIANIKNETKVQDVDNLEEEISVFESFDVEGTNIISQTSYTDISLDDLTKEQQKLIIEELKVQYEEMSNSLEETKENNGWISGLWDKFKNATGIGASYNKSKEELNKIKNELSKLNEDTSKLAEVYKEITGNSLQGEELVKFLNGETTLISSTEAGEKVAKYQKGQSMCVDVMGDIVSGIVAVGAVALAPVSGGLSLAGLAVGATAGSVTKVALKASDCIGNERTYQLKDLGYDVITGGINGAMGPVTNALGGATGTAIMKSMGMEALETTVKGTALAVTKESAEAAGKNALKNILKTGIAKTADMMVDGSLSGATDGFSRALAEGRIEDIPKEMLTGGLGGLIASPLIGGGMNVIGKAGTQLGNAIRKSDIANNIPTSRAYNAVSGFKSAASDKLDDVADKLKGLLKNTKLGKKITTDYDIAKANFLNQPTLQGSDTKVVQEMSEFIQDFSDFVVAEDALGGQFTGLKKSIDDLADVSFDLSWTLLELNDELTNIVQQKSSVIKDLLECINNGEKTSDKIAELVEKGIDITELLDEKTLSLLQSFDEKLTKSIEYQEIYRANIDAIIDFPNQHADEIKGFSEQAKKILGEIPETKAFKQLGELPDRVSKASNVLKTKLEKIQVLAKEVQEKMRTGTIDANDESLSSYYDELNDFLDTVDKTTLEGQECAQRAGLIDTFNTLKDRIENKMGSESFSALSSTAKAQSIVEESNIALSKFIQTMSSDETLPNSVRKFFKEFTSNCTVTRNLDEAQVFADELYGNGKYTIKKSFGAGTIGETYLVADSNGNEFVMKMLKKGVTEEKFEADRAMFTKYIEEFVTDEADKEYKVKLINGLFDSWEKELDYGAEALGAKQMQNSASRFNVAQTVELGTYNGKNVSLIMEKADGVGLDTLLDLLKFKGEHPDDYLSLSILNDEGKELNPWIKNEGLIEQNDWIKDTESYRESLPIAYQKAQNEQSMFISSSGEKTIHADPHGGNVFVSFDAETQTPKITYIDTGNVITRTNSEILSDISLSLNMLIGNSEGIATSLLDGAILPAGSSKDEMAKKVAQLLDERLYKAGINLKDVNYTQSTMMDILKELNIIPNSANSNLLKANLQRIKTSREIFAITGTEANKAIDIKDMLNGIVKSFKANPKETYKTIKPIVKWAMKNSDQFLITFFQMMFKNSDFEKALSTM